MNSIRDILSGEISNAGQYLCYARQCLVMNLTQAPPPPPRARTLLARKLWPWLLPYRVSLVLAAAMSVRCHGIPYHRLEFNALNTPSLFGSQLIIMSIAHMMPYSNNIFASQAALLLALAQLEVKLSVISTMVDCAEQCSLLLKPLRPLLSAPMVFWLSSFIPCTHSGTFPLTFQRPGQRRHAV